jgi:septal ring factor EnvC (AmiA/AmiB activator)
MTSRPSRLALRGLASCLLAGLLACPPPAWAAAPRAAASAELQQARAAEREQLRERLTTLRRAIAASEASRNEAADALAASERTISDTNRQLRELDIAQQQLQTELGGIGTRQSQTQAHISTQQARLAALLHRQYIAGGQDALKLLFSGANPNLIQRDLHYQSYVAQAQAEALRDLQTNLDTLRDLAEQTRERDAELTRITTARQAQRAALLREQHKRRELLTSIAEKLRLQRREAGALERDEKRLSRVVEELARLLEKQARERDQARARERELARQRATKPEPPRAGTSPPGRPPVVAAPRESAPERNELVADDTTPGAFAQLKGRLRLPLRGALGARFGSSRPEGGPSWKGLFIRAQQGVEVKSVAAGRVVFAEWLRGFGNLLIVDHGDQYLSIYGNNESLFKQPGDAVAAGDTIAAVGNSGGNPETGLYFELRFRGRPFDPLSWARLN